MVEIYWNKTQQKHNRSDNRDTINHIQILNKTNMNIKISIDSILLKIKLKVEMSQNWARKRKMKFINIRLKFWSQIKLHWHD